MSKKIVKKADKGRSIRFNRDKVQLNGYVPSNPMIIKNISIGISETKYRKVDGKPFTVTPIVGADISNDNTALEDMETTVECFNLQGSGSFALLLDTYKNRFGMKAKIAIMKDSLDDVLKAAESVGIDLGHNEGDSIA